MMIKRSMIKKSNKPLNKNKVKLKVKISKINGKMSKITIKNKF